jgi:DNA-directed RNA polymerase specialized sigma24 family protein
MPYQCDRIFHDTRDARAWLTAQLAAGIDAAPEGTRLFLAALHWRQRSVVCLLYGERLTQEQVGWLLGVTPRTIQSDVADVCQLLLGAK